MKVAAKAVISIPVLLALFMGFAFTSPCPAGTLSITSQTSVTVTGERLQGAVLVINRGDVPAHNVRADVTILGETIGTQAKPVLGVNESGSFLFERRLGAIQKGRYPVTVMVYFHDAKDYAFSSLSCTTFSYGENVKGDLVSSGDSLSMGIEGALQFRLVNPGSERKNVRATIILPREFSSPLPSMDFQLEPESRKIVSFPVTNFSAFSGATYPVFSFFEYDLGDTHHTVVCTAILKITGGGNWFRQTRWYWAGGWVLLLGGFVLFRRIRKTLVKAKKVDIF